MFGKKAKRRRTVGDGKPERVPSTEPVSPSRQNKVFFITALLVVLFVSVLLFRPFLVAVTTGLLLAYLSRPLYRVIRRAVRLRGLSAVATLLVVLLIFVVPLAGIGFILVAQATDFATNLATQEPPEFILEGLDLHIRSTVDDPDNETLVNETKQEFVQDVLRRASATTELTYEAEADERDSVVIPYPRLWPGSGTTRTRIDPSSGV